MDKTRFSKQVGIVTGGADGLGYAVAQRLSREGADVCLMDMDADKLAKAKQQFADEGLTVHTEAADVADDNAVAGAMQTTVDRAGRLDILVHCAGIVGPNGRKVTDVSPDEFDAVCRVNLLGSFVVTRQALLHMTPKNYGRILLFASIAGKEGNAGMACYSASKAGVIGLTKSVGKEFADTGITVNALAPAVIRTAMVDSMEPDQVRYMTDKIPMRRCGTLDEVAALSCWIVSKEASFNTGVTFDLSGGRATY